MFEFVLAIMIIVFLLACSSCSGSTPNYDKMFRNSIEREMARPRLSRFLYDNLFVVGGVRYPIR